LWIASYKTEDPAKAAAVRCKHEHKFDGFNCVIENVNKTLRVHVTIDTAIQKASNVTLQDK